MERFEASFDSLRNYQCPEWFRDGRPTLVLETGSMMRNRNTKIQNRLLKC